jgi:hypothetical protein
MSQNTTEQKSTQEKSTKRKHTNKKAPALDSIKHWGFLQNIIIA